MMLSAANQAFLYYFQTTLYNRAKLLVGRLRQPRYVVGVVLVVVYFVYLYKRVGFASPYFLIAIYSLLIFVSWLSIPFSSAGGTGRALTFRQADVQLLFCAPLSRRNLLQFKFMQNQGLSFISAFIFSMLSRNIEGVSFIRLILGLLLVGNIVNLNTTLVNVAVAYFRRANKGFVIYLFSGLVALIIGSSIWRATNQALSTTADITNFYQMPAIATVLEPIWWLLAPALSTSVSDFVQSLWIPVVVFGVHLLLFFTIPFPFEDNAIVTAERLENLRKHGLSALRKKETLAVSNNKHSRIQKLALVGPQWRAVLWKNLLSVGRLRPGLFKRLLFYILLAFVVANFLPERIQFTIAVVLGILAVYLVLVGPALLRVDLRIDIPHFDMIKAMPIYGRQLIFGEIFAPQLVIFGFQAVAFIAATLLVDRVEDTPLDAVAKIQILCVALPVLFALTFFYFTLQNLMALYLPSFTRFGRNVQRGVDQYGQNFLGVIVRLLSLTLALIPVAIVVGLVGVVGIKLLGLNPRFIAIIVAVLGSAILFAEALLLIYISDARYRHFDISAENIAVEE